MAWDSLMNFQGTLNQKEGQEDQEKVKELGGGHLAVLRSPGPPGLLALASLQIHPAQELRDFIQ